ncbi:hypothetical protein JKF63_05026 [Porcisia hertigi]|uniref:Uncharacterized protein n=1 Tax=Porcisia hertigi TaxID=2761500 RepID=A0A836IT78_9TRYP|nr:hypothetical protein JKF63_05026 [Porcisia hertigi]
MSEKSTSTDAKDAPMASLTEFINYMDIKLEGVHHIPANWVSAGFPPVTPGTTGGASNSGSNLGHAHGKEGQPDETEVAYAFHPFRYEVTLELPCAPSKQDADKDATDVATAEALNEQSPLPTSNGTNEGMCIVASFKRGRLLAPLTQYMSYIAAAEPPPAPGVDDASPLRDVPIAISAEDTVDHSIVCDNEKRASDAENAVSPGTTAPPAGAPVILWVMTDRTDAPSAGAGTNSTDAVGSVASKRRVKLTASLAAASSMSSVAAAANNAAAAAAPGAPAPSLPESSDPAPCVVRVPLTAAQEAYLDNLLESGAPLRMRFRRVLRPGCPAEWEDFNAGYFEADIPISLQALTEPGSTHLTADVALQPVTASEKSISGAFAQSDSVDMAERGKKRTVTRKQRQMVPSILIDGPDRDAPHPYVVAGTTATVSLTLQRTLTRLVSDRVRPAVTPAQLIPPRPPPTVSAAAADDAQTCLQQALRGMVQRLVRDIRGAATSESVGPSEPDNAVWRKDFVLALESTGELAAFKSKLTPLVTDLVQERLRKDPATGVSPQEVARASSELYVQLMDMLHSALHEFGGEGDAGSNVVPPPQTTSSGGVLNRSEEQEERWRAIEAEVTGDVELAANLYHSRLATHVSDDSWAALWVDCALFYQRIDQLAKAEQCYREAIACDPVYTPALLDYGAWLLAHDRLDEAAVFLHGLVDYVPQHKLGWGCIALLADLHELAICIGSPEAVAEQKKWRREQRLALRKAVECGSVIPNPTTGGPGSGGLPANVDSANAPVPPNPTSASPQQDGEEEHMYFEVATYLVNLHHRDLANVCLARCRPGEPRVELLYASLFTQGGQYEEALKTLEAMATPSVAYASASVEEQRLIDQCALLRAECVAALGRPSDAVRLYKQALCHGEPVTGPPYLAALAADWQTQSLEGRSGGGMASASNLAQTLLDHRITETSGIHFLSAYLRLCNLLLAEGLYRDALGVVTLALQVWPSSSVLWLGAGVAYYRAGDLIQAEECLQESNTLNPSNPRTWAYLALLGARLQEAGVEELLHQLLTLKLEDAPLWAELGRTLLGTAQYASLSVLCLRRAVALVDGKDDAAESLKLSTQYHLAHALMDLHQWEEAGRLLGIVASHGGSNEVLRGKAEEELAMLRVGQ